MISNFTEDARLEAEIEAAKAASRRKAEMELKQQREREREAARAAVEKVYHFFQSPIIIFIWILFQKSQVTLMFCIPHHPDGKNCCN